MAYNTSREQLQHTCLNLDYFVREETMKITKTCLLIFLGLLLFDNSPAAEPELITEIATQGEAVCGDLLHGKLNLSFPQGFRILTAEGRAAFRAELLSNQGLSVSQEGKYFGITSYSTKAAPGILATEKFELELKRWTKCFGRSKAPQSRNFSFPMELNWYWECRAWTVVHNPGRSSTTGTGRRSPIL